jgi:hypothetical protein
MPQPLSRVAPSALVSMGNIGPTYSDPLVERPELAILAVQVIASWSNVEAFMMRLFVSLMGGSTELAATVYLSLEIQSAKSAAINAAADAKLSEPERALLRAILALVKSHQKSRDKIAHWIWGFTQELPDALLLANPKDLIDIPPDKDRIFVYRKKDFLDCIAANERLAGYSMSLAFMFSAYPDSEMYKELCDELFAVAEIQERVSRPAERD